MKDKITKKNMTRFDYRARRLGIIGACLLVLSVAVVLPIATHVSSSNSQIQAEIQQLHNEIDNEQYVVENK